MKLKKALKRTLFILSVPVVFVVLYLLAAWLLSRISTGKEAGAPGIAIYIKTNGVHTDIVVPLKTEEADWSRDILFAHTTSKDSLMQLIAFGWGDKGFYLETPTWNDLTFSTAFKAAFGLGHAAMHTTYYKNVKEGADCVKIEISKEQYRNLISYIRSSFRNGAAGQIQHIITNANYGANDAFYEAGGSYSLFHTCNTWANNALKSCGQKACLWTPFDSGIFYQYRQ